MSSSVTAQNRNDIYELITHTYKNTFTLKNIFKILLEKKNIFDNSNYYDTLTHLFKAYEKYKLNYF